MGTLGMKERAVLLGGTLRIDSNHGDGTVVQGIFPRELLMPPAQHQSPFSPKELQ
jgi:glucose-6-phosphate-specific signal transduction histidine kinase